jgi:hypothetical protein
LEEYEKTIQNALDCARSINDEPNKSKTLKDLSCELANHDDWFLSEIIGFEISKNTIRQQCWKELAEINLKEKGWKKALQKNVKLQNKEARFFYLQGWVESLSIIDVDKLCIQQSLPHFLGDISSIEKLLHSYSLHQVFFSKQSKKHIAHLNRTLNIQWAIDISNNLNKN